MEGVDRDGSLLGAQALRRDAARKREAALQIPGLVLAHLERAGERGIEFPATPLEDAGELAHAAVRDSESRAFVADRDSDECRAVAIRRRGDRAEQGERLEVDPREREPGEPASLDVAVDELAVRDDEEDAPEHLAALGLLLAEHAVVEHRLVERDRQRLLGAEPNRVEELIFVVDGRELEAPHADAAARNAESDAATREVVVLEEGAERVCK